MKDNLIFSDKARVVNPKKSSSYIDKIEKNLIEFKNIVQSDDFSFGREHIEIFYAEKIENKESIDFYDNLSTNKISVFNEKIIDNAIIKDVFIESKKSTQEYEIVSPENNYSTVIGKSIYFECNMVTNDELLKEDFENLIWISSVDGLIGVKNNFFSMLSAGEHIISLIMKENDNKIIKSQIKIYVHYNSTDLPEINKL